MKNCSGINCPMQHGVVDVATCQAVECCPYATQPITNADRIRSMTDDELAKWLTEVANNGGGSCAPEHYDCTNRDDCVPCWLDWLKQEVKE